jgi:predicted nuclease with RNAse H fold
MFYYLGVDLGGGSNTWAVALKKLPKRGLLLENVLSFNETELKNVTSEEILAFVKNNRVLALSIDAPLSFSLKVEKGFRLADLALRNLLPGPYRKWVLSYHTLMGIPLRGLLLAQKLSPYCGTILETHPRASFYFLLPEEKRYLASKYKKEGLLPEETDFLINYFEKHFFIKLPKMVFDKADFLDAFICSLTSYIYVKAPEKLLFLPQEEDLTGFGPFVIYFKKRKVALKLEKNLR